MPISLLSILFAETERILSIHRQRNKKEKREQWVSAKYAILAVFYDSIALIPAQDLSQRSSNTSAAIKAPGPQTTVLSTLAAYHAYLQSRGYSQYTPAQFVRDVKRFGFFVREKKLAEITSHDIHQWITTLKGSRMPSYTAKTISRILSAITNYFSWLTLEQAIAVNPAAEIHNVKVISPLPDILFEQECRSLRATASTDSRLYLLVLLLLETAIKKEELFALRLTHIDCSNKYAPELWVKHTGKKVKKDRKLKLPPEFAAVFEEYMATYQVTDALFPYTPRLVEYLLKDLAQRAGIQKKVIASILRDTCAVRWLQSGKAIETVLLKLGLSESTWEDAKVKYTQRRDTCKFRT